MVKPSQPIDIYVRVSRVGKRGEKLISPDEQELRARGLASEKGLRVGIVLTDLDESGGKLVRPGLTEALERVERGESGGVIVAWLDRLSRDSEHAHGLVRRIGEAGGVIYAPDAPSDWTTPEGELQAGILFAFATYVRKRAAAGFERAKENAISRGIPVNTRAAVGYRKRSADGQDRRLERDPASADAVCEVFARRAAGEGPAALGAYLESLGVRTSQGSATWSKQAIYNMISNRVYLGELSYGRDERYVNAAAHPPLVDLATWQAAQHPSGRRLSPARSEASPFMLTGLIRCHACGYCLQATITSRRTRIYRCTRTHSGGVCPTPARANAEDVETRAVEAFWSAAADREATGGPGKGPDIEGHEAELRRAESALQQWASPEMQESIGDIGLYAAGMRERRERRDSAAATLGQSRAEASAAVALPSVETLRSLWDAMSTQDRRGLLAAAFDCLTLSREPRIITFYPAGTGPTDLPRRGFKHAPALTPFADVPHGARTLPL